MQYYIPENTAEMDRRWMYVKKNNNRNKQERMKEHKERKEERKKE